MNLLSNGESTGRLATYCYPRLVSIERGNVLLDPIEPELLVRKPKVSGAFLSMLFKVFFDLLGGQEAAVGPACVSHGKRETHHPNMPILVSSTYGSEA